MPFILWGSIIGSLWAHMPPARQPVRAARAAAARARRGRKTRRCLTHWHRLLYLREE